MVLQADASIYGQYIYYLNPNLKISSFVSLSRSFLYFRHLLLKLTISKVLCGRLTMMNGYFNGVGIRILETNCLLNTDHTNFGQVAGVQKKI